MQDSDTWWRTFNTRPMADRQIDQLIGLAQGIVADGIVNQAEAETLQNWLRANQTTDNPYVNRLLDQVERVLEDGVLDDDEGRELHDALMSWTGGGGADGEESTTASLPLDPAPRSVRIAGNIFVFTGTGVFGTRRMMQDATVEAGWRHGGKKHHDADQLPGPRNIRHASMGLSELRAEDREGDGLPRPKGNTASDRA